MPNLTRQEKSAIIFRMSVICITRTKKRDPRTEVYLYGRTLRILTRERGSDPERLFDTDGTPVLDDELYQVTDKGIERVE